MNNKILFILHIPPPIHGAAVVGKYIKESKIINNSFNCKYINLGTSKTVDEVNNVGLQKWIRYFKILVNTIQTIHKFKPDLVYITLNTKGIGLYKDALIAFIAKLKGTKVVYHFHNKGIKAHQHKLFDNFLYRKVFHNAKVILLSTDLYTDVQKYVTEENVYFCPNGIPQVDNRNLISNNKSNTIEILFLSNLIESKGVFVLLEACKLLKRKQINFHCSFVGGIGDISEEKFQSTVKGMELESNVDYKGKMYGSEKESAFLNTDIFVHPTYEDCFPLVILEAMQYSLPIISTLEGSIPSMVENGSSGFLVDKENSLALAEQLEGLIHNNELRVVMGKAGRKRYEENFTLKIFENNLKTILTTIVNE